MSLCDTCRLRHINLNMCKLTKNAIQCSEYRPYVIDVNNPSDDVNALGEEPPKEDVVHSPSHYTGGIECIDYLRDKLTPAEFTGFCMGNVLKYCSRWRKKDGLQDLKKAMVYLGWAIENEEKNA